MAELSTPLQKYAQPGKDRHGKTTRLLLLFGWLRGIGLCYLSYPAISTLVLLLHMVRQSPLDRGNAVTQAEGNPLSLRADANVSTQLSIVVVLLFDRNIDQGILSKNTNICLEKMH